MNLHIKKVLTLILILFSLSTSYWYIEYKETKEKEYKVSLVCDNLKEGEIFKFDGIINNKNIFKSEESFLYSEHSLLASYDCMVKLKDEKVVSKIFKSYS